MFYLLASGAYYEFNRTNSELTDGEEHIVWLLWVRLGEREFNLKTHFIKSYLSWYASMSKNYHQGCLGNSSHLSETSTGRLHSNWFICVVIYYPNLEILIVIKEALTVEYCLEDQSFSLQKKDWLTYVAFLSVCGHQNTSHSCSSWSLNDLSLKWTIKVVKC